MRLNLDQLYIIYLKSLIKLNRLRISIKDFDKRLNLRKKLLLRLDESKNWFEKKVKSIQLLFEYEKLRNHIFKNFAVLWEKGNITEDKEIYAIITQVSVANAVLAGLPGKLGIGVFVCIALEFYMALAIARKIGFKISEDDLDETELKSWIWEKFKSLAPYGLYFTFVGFIAVFAFKHMFSFVFSLVPGPVSFVVVVSEYVVTTFVGILFWTSFEQVNDPRNKIILKSTYEKTKNLLVHQKDSLKHTFTRENIEDAYKKLHAWFTGDYLENLPKIRGDVFVSIAIGQLLIGKHDALEGPLGQMFLQSIRDRWSQLEEATPEDISVFMNEAYSQDQIPGVINVIKGKFFENLVEAHENADGDEWTAMLHEDESYPGSDMIMTNADTGETIELSLKATQSANYIESSLLKYPEIPIMVSSEVSEQFKDLDMIIASDFRNSDIQEITESNFEELVNNLTPFSKIAGISATTYGVTMASVVSIWPFVVAYKRGKISRDKLQKACEIVFPKSGEELVYRITYITIFGPIYGWYVLARTAMSLTPKPKEEEEEDIKYLVYKKNQKKYKR